MFELTIPGDPIPLQRPRFVNGRVWDKQKDIRAEKVSYLKNLVGALSPIYGPLGIALEYYILIPASFSRKKTRDYLDMFHCKRPDLDNYVKFTLDICADVLYKDDAQICYINACKMYSTEPRTEIRLFYLGDKEEQLGTSQ